MTNNTGIKTLVAALTVLLLVCSSVTANAGLTEGDHYLASGKKVELSGLVWKQFEDTTMTRTSLEPLLALHPDWNTYRYATRTETEALLDSLWGGTTEGWDSSNFEGAEWFSLNIANLNYTSNTLNTYQFHFGDDFDCTNNTFTGCLGLVGHDGPSLQGFFVDGLGLSEGRDPGNNNNSISKNEPRHHLLVRGASAIVSAPAPPMISIVALGVLGLASRRFKR